MDGSAKTSRTGTPPGFPENICRISGERRVRCSAADGQPVRTAADAFPSDSQDADGWGSRQVEEHIDMKVGGGPKHARTHSGRAASRRAGQRLIPAVILVRRQYQNGCNPFVPVRAAHTEGVGKAKAARWSDRDGGADRASETVGGGGISTRKTR